MVFKKKTVPVIFEPPCICTNFHELHKCTYGVFFLHASLFLGSQGKYFDSVVDQREYMLVKTYPFDISGSSITHILKPTSYTILLKTFSYTFNQIINHKLYTYIYTHIKKLSYYKHLLIPGNKRIVHYVGLLFDTGY
jgi:hypothetical protein